MITSGFIPAAMMDFTAWSSPDQLNDEGPTGWIVFQLASIRTHRNPMLCIFSISATCWFTDRPQSATVIPMFAPDVAAAAAVGLVVGAIGVVGGEVVGATVSLVAVDRWSNRELREAEYLTKVTIAPSGVIRDVSDSPETVQLFA